MHQFKVFFRQQMYDKKKKLIIKLIYFKFYVVFTIAASVIMLSGTKGAYEVPLLREGRSADSLNKQSGTSKGLLPSTSGLKPFELKFFHRKLELPNFGFNPFLTSIQSILSNGEANMRKMTQGSNQIRNRCQNRNTWCRNEFNRVRVSLFFKFSLLQCYMVIKKGPSVQ